MVIGIYLGRVYYSCHNMLSVCVHVSSVCVLHVYLWCVFHVYVCSV